MQLLQFVFVLTYWGSLDVQLSLQSCCFVLQLLVSLHLRKDSTCFIPACHILWELNDRILSSVYSYSLCRRLYGVIRNHTFRFVWLISMLWMNTCIKMSKCSQFYKINRCTSSACWRALSASPWVMPSSSLRSAVLSCSSLLRACSSCWVRDWHLPSSSSIRVCSSERPDRSFSNISFSLDGEKAW